MSELAAPTQGVQTTVLTAGPSGPSRLMSLDALRGFDMFWILGADALVYALDRLSKNAAGSENSVGVAGFLAYELKHADWAGFHFYDLIFPLFVFIVGVSLVLSLNRMVEAAGRAEAVKRVIRRGILLYVIGVLYSGGISDGWDQIRWMGVLNRIAICYLCTGLIYLYCNVRAMIAICIAVLISYWAMMTFVPIRNIQLEKANLQELAKRTGINDPHVLFNNTTDRVTGHFEHGFNLANHIDFQYLPGRKYDTYFDPEGYLSNLPAIATCLFGVFAALLLRSQLLDQQKLIYLVTAGIVAASIGWAWHMQFPVVKKIWTSSFVLVAGGYSALLLAAFYVVVDVLKFQTWCRPFVWIGMNPITLYLTSNIIGGFRKPAQRFVGGDVTAYLDQHIAKGAGDLLVAIVGLLMLFWFAHFLYKRKIFLRL